MKSVEELLPLCADYLKGRGVEQPRRQAEELLAAVLGIRRLDLFLQFDRPVEDAQVDQFRGWMVRRGKGEPTQYITGCVEFFGCEICVAPGVLIPRPETELLVDRIARAIEGEGRLLDLCCGSGCIAIALKRRFPKLEVVASDLSSEALKQARENGRRNGVEITWIESDLFDSIEGKFHYIVSNPPYVAQRELAALQREVRDWEPEGALVSGESGYEIYERIASEAPAFLEAGGRLWLELGFGQGERVCKLFSWGRCEVASDWSGHDRFFALEFD